MSRKWLWSLMVLVLSFSLILSGCGTSQNADQSSSADKQSSNQTTKSNDSAAKPTVLKVITQDRWAPYVKDAVSMWNSKHADQKVKLNLLVLGYPQLRQKISTAVAAGEAPDFSLIDSVWVAEFANGGFLKPLNEIDPAWVKNEYSKDFYPVFVKGDSYKGKPYAIHTQTDMAVVWYRKDWFKKENLQEPKTWKDLVADAKYFSQAKMKKKYGNAQGIAFPAGVKAAETTTYQIMPFLWSNGADVFQNGKVVLNSDQTKQALSMLLNLVKDKAAPEDVISYEWNRSMQLLSTGKTALSVGGSYEKSMIVKASGWTEAQFKDKVGFVPVPAGPDGKQATTAGGMAYAIYKQSKHPKMALNILKLITGPQLMKEFVVKTQQNSPRISVTKSLDANKQSFLIETGKFLYNAKARPVTPQYAKVSTQIQKMVENEVSGHMSVDKAVSNAANVISQITGLPEK